KVKSERFVSVDCKELYANRLQFENLGEKPVEICVTSLLNANVFNEDANYDDQFWNVLDKQAKQQALIMTAQTIENDFGTPRFTVAMKAIHQTSLKYQNNLETAKSVSACWRGELFANEKAEFEKKVIVTTSRDYSNRSVMEEAAEKLSNKQAVQSFEQLLAAHVLVWAKRWEKSDIVIDGN